MQTLSGLLRITMGPGQRFHLSFLLGGCTLGINWAEQIPQNILTVFFRFYLSQIQMRESDQRQKSWAQIKAVIVWFLFEYIQVYTIAGGLFLQLRRGSSCRISQGSWEVHPGEPLSVHWGETFPLHIGPASPTMKFKPCCKRCQPSLRFGLTFENQ